MRQQDAGRYIKGGDLFSFCFVAMVSFDCLTNVKISYIFVFKLPFISAAKPVLAAVQMKDIET